ncbi:putative transferase family protein [Elsinoe australis]|uniref:Putative transferase family protein n=1 Tax=Elsinoe australis TaxID=40998 RepID=A0A4U7ASZ9_9PEZI|nr:putative transferase family protein [Elsinoe australis]
MKVDVVRTLLVRPLSRRRGVETALLLVIDAWYAYVRAPTSIYIFEKSDGTENIQDQLLQSLSQTLDVFPQYTGTLQPYSVTKNGHEQRRAQVVWGGDGSGAEVIEARTNARIRHLLPPEVKPSSAFMWDRTGQSLRSLFPSVPSSHGLRIQMTAFRCGGFSIAIDFDHGLADAHTFGLFMQIWSTTHNKLFGQADPMKAQEELPSVYYDFDFLEKKFPVLEKENEAHQALLHRARTLPTRRPDYRELFNPYAPTDTDTATKLSPPSLFSGTPIMLHVTPHEYELITQSVQERTSVPITDQVAFVSFLWAALNRARASTRYPIGLHLPTSLRWTLDLPSGLSGCPILAIMMTGDKAGPEAMTDPALLASEIKNVLDQYDEDAMLAVVADAHTRDSPASAARPGAKADRMEFSSAVQFGSSKTSFGSLRPTYFAPLIPIDNLFLMVEGLPTGEAADVGDKWYKYGANVFFSLPNDVLRNFILDPAFDSFQKLVDPEMYDF